MRNTGLRRPALNAAICFAACLGGIVSVVAGIVLMQAAGQETTASAVMIGGGLVVAILGAAMLFNFLRGVKVVAAIRRGEGEIARWTVSADDFDAFRANDARRNALGPEYQNGYTPPDQVLPGGVEVVFVPDGVLVGGSYFGLVTTGMNTFFGPQILRESPPCIEFGTVLVWASHLRTQIQRTVGTLRVPIARTAVEDAARVLAHFQKVEKREIIVNPGFYRGRMRFGLYATAACVLIAAAGFGLEAIETDLGDVPMGMAVGGAVGAIGGLVLALLAWRLSVRQRRAG